MAENKMNFTEEQQSAIHASGGALVVSAAAGSGKTRVLVQRVIEMLLSEEKPVYADRLLIVTFTKAAAAEMKQRILNEVERLLKENPENTHLRRQQVLLPNADICTVHSFCSRIVKENFSALDINQDFRIAEPAELSVMEYRVMSDIIEKQYALNKESFRLLSTILSSPKNDVQLERTLLEVYHKAAAHPDMESWLKKAEAMYQPTIPLKETIFAEIAYERLLMSVQYFEDILDTADRIVYDNPDAFCKDTATSAEKKLDSQKKFVSRLRELAENKDWNGISDTVVSYRKQKYLPPRGKNICVSRSELQTLKIIFTTIDNETQAQLRPIFGITEEVYQSDTEQIYPAVCCMCDILREFESGFFEKKKEKGILDFSDLEHLTLKLLTGKDGRKSALAENISQKYDAVMVDEFQDTNEIQDRIFRYVSRKEENMFVVGDVKQSIYRFREAMPEIFKSRIQNASEYRKGGAFPACIRLDKNFRSRPEVVDSVNFVFRTIMSEYMGDIEYNEKEMMKAGAVYPENPPLSATSYETEIHVLNTYSESEDDGRTEYEKEAVYIAKIIKEMIANGFQVSDNGTLRTAKYSDFCILMRFVSSHAHEYSEVMNQYGVPTYVSKPYSLLECYETNMVLSLLKAVDNRLQDIPMLAVMLCPVFGFTPDDLAYLKLRYQSAHLYPKIFQCSKTEDTDVPDGLREKCSHFIDLLGHLRKLSVTQSVSELTEIFFEKTGYIAVISAMSNGEIRIKNVRKLMSFIRDYENGAKGNLSEFIRHILYLEKSGTEISADDTAPEDSVKIMSIHHSKGLEYPVCILAGLNMKGNTIAPDIYCHKTLGFGMKMTDSETLCKYDTLQRNIILQSAEHEELSEAMRVLYVAMTRAREKLIAVTTFGGKKTSKKSDKTPTKDPLEEKLKEIASFVRITDGKIEPHCVENAGTFANWILMCALAHPSMKSLRARADAEDIIPIPTPSKWRYAEGSTDSGHAEKSVQEQTPAEPDQKLLSLLGERFGQTYKYASRLKIPAKVSASALVHQESGDSYIAQSRPSFMQGSSMTGAEKGTAMHTFLQYAEFSNLEDHIHDEKQRLLHTGKLSQEQYDNIHEEDIQAFIQSQTYRSILQAEKLYREYQFTVNISAGEADESYDENETVILQGAMDCLVYHSDGLIIIDYKTDHVRTLSELKRRYARQLALYKNAAEQIFEIPVKKCIIYSIRLGSEIEI